VIEAVAIFAAGIITGYKIAVHRLRRRRMMLDGMLGKLHKEFGNGR